MYLSGAYLKYSFCLTDNLLSFPLLKELEQFIKKLRDYPDIEIERIMIEQEEYLPKKVVYLIIYDNRNIVAMCRLIYKGFNGYINMVFVNPEYRNQKICQNMLALLFEVMPSLTSIKKYKLDVNTENVSAIKCYEKAGFVIVKRTNRNINTVMVYQLN